MADGEKNGALKRDRIDAREAMAKQGCESESDGNKIECLLRMTTK